MAKKKDERFIYTTNDMKIGARAKLNGQIGLALVSNLGQVQGFIPASTLNELLYDSQKPCFQIETPPPRQNP